MEYYSEVALNSLCSPEASWGWSDYSCVKHAAKFLDLHFHGQETLCQTLAVAMIYTSNLNVPMCSFIQPQLIMATANLSVGTGTQTTKVLIAPH